MCLVCFTLITLKVRKSGKKSGMILELKIAHYLTRSSHSEEFVSKLVS